MSYDDERRAILLGQISSLDAQNAVLEAENARLGEAAILDPSLGY